MSNLDTIKTLQARMGQSIIGQEDVIEMLLVGLLANGNILLEGLPGLAKTRAVKALARNLAVDFSRVQFTPDLLPSDVTGTEMLYTEGGENVFRFDEGPIFANLVLADEVNRAPAKVQAALLEAMEERQVTVAGTTHPLPELFMVMATQNPIEQEGTYPLPEAQMDRFLLHVLVEYGTEEAEGEVIRLVRGEEQPATAEPEAPIDPQTVLEARREISAVTVSPAIERYIVDLIYATRFPERYGAPLQEWIQVGGSPRASIGLDKCARVMAWLKGRDHVLPDDVKTIAGDVLRHRLKLSYEASADGVSASRVIERLLEIVAVPA